MQGWWLVLEKERADLGPEGKWPPLGVSAKDMAPLELVSALPASKARSGKASNVSCCACAFTSSKLPFSIYLVSRSHQRPCLDDLETRQSRKKCKSRLMQVFRHAWMSTCNPAPTPRQWRGCVSYWRGGCLVLGYGGETLSQPRPGQISWWGWRNRLPKEVIRKIWP